MINFEKNQDPKKTIGIGFFSPKYFTDFEELKIWLLQNFTKILGLDYLPDPRLSTNQWIELKKYSQKYIFLDKNHLSDWEINQSMEKIVDFYHDMHEIRNLYSDINKR
jgi:hypothetical protein